MIARKTLAKLDRLLEDSQDTGHRAHLGASTLGRKCERLLFYSFRWCYTERHEARMLRLFDRGHRSESGVFFGHLRSLGAEVWETDPQTGNQWRIIMAGGHSGGSADGVARGGLVELPPDDLYLVECKTHNDKSFRKLEESGVATSKPEHYAQMQLYLSGLELDVALYMAVNKNDDTLHLELIRADPDVASRLVDKAERVVFAGQVPPRPYDSPAWFECKFCPAAGVCWRGEKPTRTCRSCRHAVPQPDGLWSCAKGEEAITANPHKPCVGYQLRPDLR